MGYWIVKSTDHRGKVVYLQDQGMLRTEDQPRGGPGLFGPKKSAFRFVYGEQASRAVAGMLGLGRKAMAVAVETKKPHRSFLVDQALADLERNVEYESDLPKAYLQLDDCSYRCQAALIKYVRELEAFIKGSK
jgi:hypothetical protein